MARPETEVISSPPVIDPSLANIFAHIKIPAHGDAGWNARVGNVAVDRCELFVKDIDPMHLLVGTRLHLSMKTLPPIDVECEVVRNNGPVKNEYVALEAKYIEPLPEAKQRIDQFLGNTPHDFSTVSSRRFHKAQRKRMMNASVLVLIFIAMGLFGVTLFSGLQLVFKDAAEDVSQVDANGFIKDVAGGIFDTLSNEDKKALAEIISEKDRNTLRDVANSMSDEEKANLRQSIVERDTETLKKIINSE